MVHAARARPVAEPVAARIRFTTMGCGIVIVIIIVLVIILIGIVIIVIVIAIVVIIVIILVGYMVNQPWIRFKKLAG